MFDGVSFVKNQSPIGSCVCHLPIDDSMQLIGTRTGLYRFDLQTLEATSIPGITEPWVAGLHRLSDDEVLVFGGDRIQQLNLKSLAVKTLLTWTDFRLVMHAVLSDGTFVFLTDKKGLFTYQPSSLQLTPIVLDGFSPKNELLLAMIFDGQSLWVGSDKGLMQYLPGAGRTTRVRSMEGNTIKSLTRDAEGALWIGTNDGLFIYHPTSQQWEHYLHDNQDQRSLQNNCVWCVFEDGVGNKWIGVDAGVSFINENQSFYQIRWSDLFDTRDGNRIMNILHDSRGEYWLGGINGLGYYVPSTGMSVFYTIRGAHQIANNRIRTVYEDLEGMIWMGTDGGPAWFDRKTQSFVTCNIEDETGSRNAAWTYGFADDGRGNLWVATCSGGLFVVDKVQLLKNGGKAVTARYNYHFGAEICKLDRDDCTNVIRDSVGNIWTTTDRALYKITQAGEAPLFFSDQSTPAVRTRGIMKLLCDQEGYVWGISGTGFVRANPENNEVIYIPGTEYVATHGDLNSMAECGEYIWFVAGNGVGVIDKKTLEIQHILDLYDSKYKSCSYDSANHLIWLGGVNHALVLHPERCLESSREVRTPVFITAAYINGHPAQFEDDIAYCDRIVLQPDENTLAFRLSTGVMAREMELQFGYYYRMQGLDGSWKELNLQKSLLEYAYLNHGDYRFEIGKRNSQSNEIEVLRSLDITIRASWYQTIWFRILVTCMLLGLFAGIINHYRVRAKLRISEIDKENMQKLSQMKMDFLTSMSHELKTPLSLILGLVNKLLGSTKSSQSREMLQIVLKNAMRLNTLVFQIINFKEVSSLQSQLVLSRLEMVEFVRSLVSVHREAFESKGIELAFVSEVGSLYMEADPMKLESVVNNLLSNACKFTPRDGKVTVGLGMIPDEGPRSIRLTVTDTGMGIPAEDLPRVFGRFYQSEKSLAVNKEGSGIGLSVAKSYVVEHGGEIGVTSDETGAIFTVLLPTKIGEELIPTETMPDAPAGEAEPRTLRVLVVEDNVDIARFIADNLKGMQCTVVHNGKSGLETALQQMPDIIVADIMMPVMDGIEMSRLLKRNLSTANIPIILLTAKDDKRTELDAYKLGVDGFLAKPFDMEQLMARIHQITRSKSVWVSKALQSENAKEETIDTAPSHDEKFMADITRIIEENLEDPELNVQKLADLSGLNSKMVYRRVKLLTGHTAVDFIKSIRLKKAAILLRQDKFTVGEVMYMVGFSSHSYFAKCFNEKYGKSPKAYMDEAGGM